MKAHIAATGVGVFAVSIFPGVILREPSFRRQKDLARTGRGRRVISTFHSLSTPAVTDSYSMHVETASAEQYEKYEGCATVAASSYFSYCSAACFLHGMHHD